MDPTTTSATTTLASEATTTLATSVINIASDQSSTAFTASDSAITTVTSSSALAASDITTTTVSSDMATTRPTIPASTTSPINTSSAVLPVTTSPAADPVQSTVSCNSFFSHPYSTPPLTSFTFQHSSFPINSVQPLMSTRFSPPPFPFYHNTAPASYPPPYRSPNWSDLPWDSATSPPDVQPQYARNPDGNTSKRFRESRSPPPGHSPDRVISTSSHHTDHAVTATTHSGQPQVHASSQPSPTTSAHNPAPPTSRTYANAVHQHPAPAPQGSVSGSIPAPAESMSTIWASRRKAVYTLRNMPLDLTPAKIISSVCAQLHSPPKAVFQACLRDAGCPGFPKDKSR